MALLLVTLTSPVLAAGQHATPPSQTPARSTQLAPDRLTRLDALLQRYVDDGRIAGAVALVLRDGKTVYERAVGWSDKESSRRMATGHDLPDRLAIEGAHERGGAVADGRGQARLEQPRQRVHPGIREDDGHRATGGRSRETAHHGSRSADAHLWRVVRNGSERGRAVRREGPGTCCGVRVVHGRQGRADLRHDGTAGVAAVRLAAGRGVGLRLQHRHSRVRGRAGGRHAARSSDSAADHGSARHEGHALLSPGRSRAAARDRVRERRGPADRAFA